MINAVFSPMYVNCWASCIRFSFQIWISQSLQMALVWFVFQRCLNWRRRSSQTSNLLILTLTAFHLCKENIFHIHGIHTILTYVLMLYCVNPVWGISWIFIFSSDFREEDREKHRQEKLKVFKETGVMPGKKKKFNVRSLNIVFWTFSLE